MTLNIPQTAALDYLEDDHTTELLFGGSAGPGKSTLGCYWQLKQRLKYPESVGLIGRSTLKTLMETTVQTFYKVSKMQGIQLGVDYKLYANKEFQFTNGSKILLKDLFYYPSDPDCDELGSLELTDAFIDEANQVNATVKNVVKSRIRLNLDEYGTIPKILFTCNPGRNWVKSEFRDPAMKGTLPKHRKFIQAFLQDNVNITKHYRQNLLDLPSHLKERLLYANWDYSNDPTQLMSIENIGNIFTNTFVKQGDKRYITADIARFGKDRIIVRTWAGWYCTQRFEFKGLKITETAAKIKQIAEASQLPMSRVLVDEDGIGGGVVDILGCKGFTANASPFTTGIINKNNRNFGSLKDQCGWYLADRVNAGEVYEHQTDPSVRDSIIEEMEQIRDASFDTDKTRKLVSKDKIKEQIGRSPDDSDTYLMRSYFDLAQVSGITIYI